MQITDRIFWRWYLFFVTICSAWYLFTWRNHTGSWFFVVLALFLGALLILLFFNKLRLDRFHLHALKLPEFLVWLICIIFVSLPSVFSFIDPIKITFHISDRLLLLLLFTGISIFFLKIFVPQRKIGKDFFLLLLIGGIIYRIGLFIPEIQIVPFSLGWSEGSRFYNASLFFSKSLYGEKYNYPVLHPSRYFLQSLPFIFGIKSIVIHRVWQVFLWISLVGLGSYCVVKRFNFHNKLLAKIFGLWLFLFFFQGAVYYHLMVCVIIVMSGYKPKHPWRTLIFVIVASVWAGISRVNWIPVPALLAVTLYLLETPVKNEYWLRYLKFPILWTIFGGSTAFAANRIYAIFSGNDVAQFSSSFSSYMIWSRLLPNTTYSPGIILGLLLVVFPLAIVTLQRVVNNGWSLYFHWIRTFGLLGFLLVFSLGGILVSVKIGGGADLHNLDAFLIFWVIITTNIILSRYKLEINKVENKMKFNYGLLFLIFIIPIMITMQNDVVWKLQESDTQLNDIKGIQEIMNHVSGRSGSKPVLYITERHLIPFGYIKNVDLEVEYEKVFLMEMVMSNNQSYLGEFHQKLENHEFSAIITDSLSPVIKDQNSPFWVENNLWVDKVIYPILNNYMLINTFQNNTINLLIPKD
jgi:hypothetical protein